MKQNTSGYQIQRFDHLYFIAVSPRSEKEKGNKTKGTVVSTDITNLYHLTKRNWKTTATSRHKQNSKTVSQLHDALLRENKNPQMHVYVQKE